MNTDRLDGTSANELAAQVQKNASRGARGAGAALMPGSRGRPGVDAPQWDGPDVREAGLRAASGVRAPMSRAG